MKMDKHTVTQGIIYALLLLAAAGAVFGLYHAKIHMNTVASHTLKNDIKGESDKNAFIPEPLGADASVVKQMDLSDPGEQKNWEDGTSGGEKSPATPEAVAIINDSTSNDEGLPMAGGMSEVPGDSPAPTGLTAYENMQNQIDRKVDAYWEDSSPCKVSHLEGKLLVEYHGQVVNGQRVPRSGSVTYDELKNLRQNLRVVNPGEMVTMDFRQDRLTVELNELGFIDRAYCG